MRRREELEKELEKITERLKKDQEREKWLKEKGYQILRFWNNDVLTNIEGVLERIKETLEVKTPSP